MKQAALPASEDLYRTLFLDNYSPMLVIDPESGGIVNANPAACSFYGYGRKELTSMRITDLNLLSKEEIFREITRARTGGAQRCLFQHRLANGAIREVEVHSSPLRVQGREFLCSVIHDVTERKATEDALKLSAQRWQTTFDAINDAICLMSNEDRILQCNRAMVELVGKPSEEIVGRCCYEVMHGSNAPLPGCPMVTMRKTQHREKIEFNLGDRWFNVIADPIFDGDNTLIGAVHTLSDITSKKLAQEALTQRSDELATVARLFRSTTTQRNLQTILKEALHGALALTGLDAGVLCLVDGDTGCLQPRVMVNVSDSMRTVLGGRMLTAGGRLCGFGARTGATSQLEEGINGDEGSGCDDGGWEKVAFHATFPLRVHNETIGDLCFFSLSGIRPEQRKLDLVQDLCGPVALAIEHVRLYEEVQRYASDLEQRVTERTAQLQREIADRRLAEGALRESEKKYRELVENANSIILRMDPEGRVTFLNEFAQRFFGYAEHEILGRNVIGTIVPEVARNGHNLQEMIQDLARHPERYARNENENMRANGERVWIAWTNRPVFDAAGRLSGCLCIGNDITELKSVEQELLRARDAAEAADRIKSAFLATMSHELRTPLNSIIGFTGILLQGLAGPLNAEQQKQLGMVQKSARHLLELINDVLDISKIEAGQLELASTPFDLGKSLAKAVQLVSPLAEAKGLGMRLDVSKEVGEIVGDQRRLEQIIINLLNNAVKFTEEGHIEVACRVSEGRIMLSVRDTGIGMRSEDIEAIFRPFHQLDTGLARKHEGTGLGLSICRKLVEMMGGRIEVESEWGAGSTFTVSLPQRQGGR